MYTRQAFHHALCDGRGIKPFVETLIYYYCQLRYKTAGCPEGVRLAGEPLLEGETLDPFLHKYDFDASKDFISLSRDAYAIPESAAKADVYKRQRSERRKRALGSFQTACPGKKMCIRDRPPVAHGWEPWWTPQWTP